MGNQFLGRVGVSQEDAASALKAMPQKSRQSPIAKIADSGTEAGIILTEDQQAARKDS